MNEIETYNSKYSVLKVCMEFRYKWINWCVLDCGLLFLCSYLIGVSCFVHASEKLLVLLRDGRKLMGLLRSFDQFGKFSSFSLFVVLLATVWFVISENKIFGHVQPMLSLKVHVKELLLVTFIATSTWVYMWFVGRMLS
jgi:hypothetical protein